MNQTIEIYQLLNGKWEAVVVGKGSLSEGSLGEFSSEVAAKLYAFKLIADCDHALHHPSGHGAIKM